MTRSFMNGFVLYSYNKTRNNVSGSGVWSNVGENTWPKTTLTSVER